MTGVGLTNTCLPVYLLALSQKLNEALASKYAHCPGCKGRYLPKKIYDREEMKKTVKENPVCSECGYRAVIISKYQELL